MTVHGTIDLIRRAVKAHRGSRREMLEALLAEADGWKEELESLSFSEGILDAEEILPLPAELGGEAG